MGIPYARLSSSPLSFHYFPCVILFQQGQPNYQLDFYFFLSFVDDPRFSDDHISSNDKGRRLQERSQLLFSLFGNRYFSSIFVYSDDHPCRGFDTATKKTTRKRYLDFICIVHQIQRDMQPSVSSGQFRGRFDLSII